MSYRLFKYPSQNRTINIGDYIQSIAARQYLPKVNGLINRDELNEYSGEVCKVIMNGWFTHRPKNWPPSKSIIPLFISFHLNATIKNQFFTQEVIDYLKQYAPIGCRDYYTVDLLRENGIDAYYTGCLTLTLGRTYQHKEESDEILFVDALFDTVSASSIFQSFPCFIKKGIFRGDLFKILERKRFLKQIFSQDVLNRAINIEHIIKDDLSEEERFNLADSLLMRYSKAKLVVTSRIHCALPCIAMGTPVIFLHGGFKHEMDSSRFNGIIDFFNIVYAGDKIEMKNFSIEGKINTNTIISNPIKPIDIIDNLQEKALKFISK